MNKITSSRLERKICATHRDTHPSRGDLRELLLNKDNVFFVKLQWAASLHVNVPPGKLRKTCKKKSENDAKWRIEGFMGDSAKCLLTNVFYYLYYNTSTARKG